jgi:DNA repair protein RecO (recombination protein O)
VVCDRCAPAGVPRADPQSVALVGALLAGDWAHIDHADPQTLDRASGLIAAFAQHHLERAVRSLGTR